MERVKFCTHIMRLRGVVKSVEDLLHNFAMLREIISGLGFIKDNPFASLDDAKLTEVAQGKFYSNKTLNIDSANIETYPLSQKSLTEARLDRMIIF